MSDDRATVYFDPETNEWVYRASGLGNCVRALVAIAGGYGEAISRDHKDLLGRTAEEGNLHEGAVIDKLAKEGWVWESTQDITSVQVIPGVVIRGHIDGRGALPGDPLHILEVKSMSNKRFDRWMKQGFEGFLKFAYQITAYMQAFPDHDVIYVVKRREDGFEHRQIIPAGEAPLSWSAVKRKVLAVEGYRRKGAFPACDITGTDAYFCPFFYLHDEVVDEPTEMTEEMSILLGELVPRRLELKGMEDEGKQAEEDRKALDKEILNLMGSADKVMVEIDGENYQITKVNSGGSSLDNAALKSDLGDGYDKYVKSYRYQYPKITAKGKTTK